MYLLSRMAISVSLEKAGPPPVSEGRRSGGPEEEIGHRHQEAEQGENCDYPRPEQENNSEFTEIPINSAKNLIFLIIII